MSLFDEIGKLTKGILGDVANVIFGQEQEQYKPTDFGSDVTRVGSDIKIPVVYGTAKVGSTLVYSTVYNNEYLVLVYVLAEGEIEQIHRVYLNGKVMPIQPNANTEIVMEKEDGFGQQIRFEARLGNEVNQPVMRLIQRHSNGEWTDNCMLNGRAYIGLVIKREIDTDTEILSRPELSAEVSGKIIRDIRDNTVVFSSNPALCIYDYLTNIRYGLGIPNEQIDLDSIRNSANFCEQSRPQFTCRGVVDQSKSYQNNIDSILNSFGGMLTHSEGKLILAVDRAGDVAARFDKDNIVGNITSTYGSSSNYCNTIDVQYKNPLAVDSYKQDVIRYPKYCDPGLNQLPADATELDRLLHSRIQRDGKIIAKTLKLEFVKDKQIIDTLATRAIKSTYYNQQVSFETFQTGFHLNPYDVISITDEDQGWIEKQFRINRINKDISPENFGKVKISATEYNDDIYQGTVDGIISTETANPLLPDPFTTEPPQNLQFQLLSQSDYGVGRLTWTVTDKLNYKSTVIDYKLTTSNDWIRYDEVSGESAYVRQLKSARYDFRIFNRNIFGGVSTFVIIRDVDLVDPRQYPQPTNLRLITSEQESHVSNTPDWNIIWDDVKQNRIPEDQEPESQGETWQSYFGHYELRIIVGNNTVRTVRTSDSNYIYTLNEAITDGLSRNIGIEVRFVSRSGNQSDAAQLSATNPQIGQLSGISVTGGISGLIATFDKPTVKDYDGCNIYISDQQGFQPSDDNLVATVQATNIFTKAYGRDDRGRKYCRIAAFDVFGTDGLVFSPEYTFDISDVVVELPDIVDADSILVPDVDDQNKVVGLKPLDGSQSGRLANFGIAANRFQIVTDTNARTAPFTVQNNNVFIDNALIRDASIESAKINSIDAGKITIGYLDAARIRAGSIIGNKIASNTTILAGNSVAQPRLSAVTIARDGAGSGYYGFQANSYGSMTDQEYLGTTIGNISSDGARQSTIFFTGTPPSRPSSFTVIVSGVTHTFNRQSDTRYVANSALWTASSVGTVVNVQFEGRQSPVTLAGMNGDDTDPNYRNYRFWSGSTLPRDANFSVDATGRMIARDAHVIGRVEANSGYFRGSINVNNRMIVDEQGNININDGRANRGLVINNQRISVFDDRGVERVRMGRL